MENEVYLISIASKSNTLDIFNYSSLNVYIFFGLLYLRNLCIRYIEFSHYNVIDKISYFFTFFVWSLCLQLQYRGKSWAGYLQSNFLVNVKLCLSRSLRCVSQSHTCTSSFPLNDLDLTLRVSDWPQGYHKLFKDMKSV